MNTKKAQFGMFAVLVLLAGLGGLALGQHTGDEKTNNDATNSSEKPAEHMAMPPNLHSEKTLYSDEKNVVGQHVVRAGRFELTDEKGNIRAVLGLNADGEPRLAMADDSGQIFATVGLEIDAKYTKSKMPTLRFRDRAGKVRTELTLDRAGDPMVILRNPRGGAIATLTGTDKSGTELLLMDDDGRPRIVQNINRNGTNMSFFDESGKVRAGLGLKPEGNPRLVFSDEQMKNKVMLGYVDGKTADKDSKEVKTMSSLALFDKDGNVLWKAP